MPLPLQSPVIVSHRDGWGFTSWMLKHRGRGNHTRVLRYYDLAPVDGDVEVCGPPPAAWTTKKNGVTHACRVLGFERDRPGCVDRLLARMRATAPGDHHTPGCGLFNKQRHRRPPA